MNLDTSENLKIQKLSWKDIRFPTSLESHGSDAMHTNPDYSCAYVIIKLKTGLEGHGLTFTCGRGTEVVLKAIEALEDLIIGQIVTEIYKNFGQFWSKLTSESQLRWIGPEKGVIHLAVSAILNALWDLWAKLLNKPLWQLLCDLEPEQLLSTIDFRYLSNVLTKSEALELLKKARSDKDKRMNFLLAKGYPAYTTQIGWIGYSDEMLDEMADKSLKQGFEAFKIKIGQNLYEDIKRLEHVRNVIGWDKVLMVDANQVWEVQEAVDWMKQLVQFKLLWIEEPTSPDDIIGHSQIRQALKPFGIGVATGEMCCNRVMFKQFLQMDALDYCQVDAGRLGGVNELLAVYLMAHKLNVKICPHAGGVGLCEMIQHLQMWDYVSLSGTQDGRFIEYVDQQHEHFINPTIIENGHYLAPRSPGYNTTMKEDSIKNYEYPDGIKWKEMFDKGLFHNPKKLA